MPRRSQIVNDELIDFNLTLLNQPSNNRLSIYSFKTIEDENLGENESDRLSEKLVELGLIYLNGEIISLEQKGIDIHNSGGWLSFIKTLDHESEFKKTEEKSIKDFEVRKLIAETIKSEFEVQNISKTKKLSNLAVFLSVATILFELIKWIVSLSA
jgi:hypothetical protein